MGQYHTDPDIIDQFQELRRKVAALAVTSEPPKYTTALRPTASTVPGIIIYNTTTSKHQGSNGSTWNDLY